MAADSTRKHARERTCDFCDRSFTRNEHLARHRRTHTRERPFDCPFCQITFPRADVREKHVKRFHAMAGLGQQMAKKPRSVQQERSKHACDHCRERKIKCDDKHPCESCRMKDILCTTSGLRKGPGRPRNTGANAHLEALLEWDAPDSVAIPEKVERWQSGTSESFTVTAASSPVARKGGGLELLEKLNNSLSGASTSQLQHSTHPTDPTEQSVQLAILDTPLPSSIEFNFDQIGNTEWNEWNFHLMDGIWELPLLEVETSFQTFNGSLEDFWNQTETSSNNHRIENAVSIMMDHFQRRSRASSPTLHATKRLWYSAPPLLQMYDKEVINVFLNVARYHLGTTFAIYANFEATSDTTHELCLAMAAVGGLFSSVAGSATVAKSLYNDARRIHFEKAQSQPRTLSFKIALSTVQTFILLAIYGICSGDKRSYEFVEAFHLSSTQAMKHCLEITLVDLEPADRRELTLTSEALEILECYHVLLLLRPPYFLSIPFNHRWQSSGNLDLANLLAPTSQSSSVAGSLREVANLGIYTWAASPRGQEYSRVWQLWRPEFIELGLERWVNAKSSSKTTPELPSMLFYHLAQLHLQVNLGLLQRFARNLNAVQETSSQTNIFDRVRQCTGGPSFRAAVWHARAMLRVIKEMFAVSGRRHQEFSERLHILEPPHLPYCIYYATLMVWYSESVAAGWDSVDRDTCIENGIHLLSVLKVCVAKVLANALRELFSEEQRNGME